MPGSSAGSIKVLSFAGARDVIGVEELALDLADLGDDKTARRVMDVVCERYPALRDHRPHIRIAVNGEYAVSEDQAVAAGDEVALIPPVAGG